VTKSQGQTTKVGKTNMPEKNYWKGLLESLGFKHAFSLNIRYPVIDLLRIINLLSPGTGSPLTPVNEFFVLFRCKEME